MSLTLFVIHHCTWPNVGSLAFTLKNHPYFLFMTPIKISKCMHCFWFLEEEVLYSIGQNILNSIKLKYTYFLFMTPNYIYKLTDTCFFDSFLSFFLLPLRQLTQNNNKTVLPLSVSPREIRGNTWPNNR